MYQITGRGYNVFSGTIATASTDTSLALNRVYKDILIVNKTPGKELGVKFNKTTNDEIAVDTTYISPLSISDMEVTQVYLSNASGSTITYYIVAVYV